MDNCKIEIEKIVKEGIESQESKKLLKKMQKTGSYLSLDNLGMDDEEDEDEDEKTKKEEEEKKQKEEEKLEKTKECSAEDAEKVTIHPIFVLERSFKKVTAVGSATACIGLRN